MDGVSSNPDAFAWLVECFAAGGIDRETAIRAAQVVEGRQIMPDIETRDRDAKMHRLMYAGGLNESQIATRLGCDQSTVSKGIKRHLNRLRTVA